MRYTIGEIFNFLTEAKTVAEKKIILKKHDSKQLRQFLKYCLDPTIEFNIPDGEIPYRESNFPTGLSPTTLLIEVNRLYIFIKKHPTEKYHGKLSMEYDANAPLHVKEEALRMVRIREERFINLLEALDNYEAKLVIQMVRKQISQIDADTVNSVFPKLIPASKPSAAKEKEDENTKMLREDAPVVVTKQAFNTQPDTSVDPVQSVEIPVKKEIVAGGGMLKKSIDWKALKSSMPKEKYEAAIISNYPTVIGLDQELRDEVKRVKKNARKRNARAKK